MSSNSQALPKSDDHPAHLLAAPVVEVAHRVAAVPRPAASDPLTPIRAMSDEEKIALFS
jgi:hypothetical protein